MTPRAARAGTVLLPAVLLACATPHLGAGGGLGTVARESHQERIDVHAGALIALRGASEDLRADLDEARRRKLVWRDERLHDLPMVGAALAAVAAALSFPQQLAWPPPLMRTVWYPTHIPLSFLAYAAWTAAAAAALSWVRDRDAAALSRIDRRALWGFGLWSLSMISGGFWGVVAWGAYFLWDPKVIWSVILWFHYATFVHLRPTPSLQPRPWVRPALALCGFLFVLVAYVGTSFLFGRSSHAF